MSHSLFKPFNGVVVTFFRDVVPGRAEGDFWVVDSMQFLILSPDHIGLFSL